MCTNGSSAGRGTPAKARRTGKPSPSRPLGAVVTDSTGRSTAVGLGSGTRGRATVSALMAGMTAPWRYQGSSVPSARILAYATFPVGPDHGRADAGGPDPRARIVGSQPGGRT